MSKFNKSVLILSALILASSSLLKAVDIGYGVRVKNDTKDTINANITNGTKKDGVDIASGKDAFVPSKSNLFSNKPDPRYITWSIGKDYAAKKFYATRSPYNSPQYLIVSKNGTKYKITEKPGANVLVANPIEITAFDVQKLEAAKYKKELDDTDKKNLFYLFFKKNSLPTSFAELTNKTKFPINIESKAEGIIGYMKETNISPDYAIVHDVIASKISKNFSYTLPIISLAILSDKPDLVIKLLTDLQADPNIEMKYSYSHSQGIGMSGDNPAGEPLARQNIKEIKKTPLQLLTSTNSKIDTKDMLRVMKELINNGADLNVKDEDGKTWIDEQIKKTGQDPATLKYLKEDIRDKATRSLESGEAIGSKAIGPKGKPKNKKKNN